MKKHAAPILAAVLLLLPVLYVGSYLVLVKPSNGLAIDDEWYDLYPMLGNDNRDAAALLFWPINQIDRKVRPGVWELRESLWPTAPVTGDFKLHPEITWEPN